MTWPIDEDKLGRVRQRMADEGLDALVVRAPDHVLYLTNYWSMKGWEIAIFPREGEPTLIAVEPQREEVEASAWTRDVRYFRGFDPDDARPPFVRALDLATKVLVERDLNGVVGVELSNAVQAPERMTGEPTISWQGYFDAWRDVAGEVRDATPLLTRLRMIKTDQEVARIRQCNRLADAAVAHVRENIRAGMSDPEVAALYEGYVHRHGIGFENQVAMARAFTLVWSGDSIRTFTATKPTFVQDDTPTLMEIWTCTDGYWNDLTKNACPGHLTPEYHRLVEQLLAIFEEAGRDYVYPGASLAEIDRFIRARADEAGYPGQPSHFVCHGVGTRAHEPPWAHPLDGATMETGMVLAVEPGVYWDGGGGLRLEDNFLVTADGSEKLSAAPDDFRR